MEYVLTPGNTYCSCVVVQSALRIVMTVARKTIIKALYTLLSIAGLVVMCLGYWPSDAPYWVALLWLTLVYIGSVPLLAYLRQDAS